MTPLQCLPDQPLLNTVTKMIVCSHKFVILCGQKETVEPRRAQHMRNEKESSTVHDKSRQYFIYGTYVLLRILLRAPTHVIGPTG